MDFAGRRANNVAATRPTRRGRDRRGRGMRGTLTPPTMPISMSRAAVFDGLVLGAVERIQRAIPECEDVEVIVEDVPPVSLRVGAPDPVPLGRAEPGQGIAPPRIVLHRRPVELRSTPGREREDLIADVVAELVAELFGIAPADVDPDYNSGRD